MTEQSQDYSDHIAKEIDHEINQLIDEAYEGATKILKKHKKALVGISKILLDQEVIDGPEFVELITQYKSGKVTAVKVKNTVSVSKKRSPKKSLPKQPTADVKNN